MIIDSFGLAQDRALNSKQIPIIKKLNERSTADKWLIGVGAGGHDEGHTVIRRSEAPE
jgi:hypothetical protein